MDGSQQDPSPGNIGKLTDAHRAVLDLGARGFTSKEIARRLGCSKSTVDQRFDRAKDLLGGFDRRETIRRYLAIAQDAECDPILYDPISIGTPQSDLPAFPQFNDIEHRPPLQMQGFVHGLPDVEDETRQSSWLPLPVGKDRQNDLTLTQRLFWICAITLLSIVASRAIIEALRDFAAAFSSQ